MKEMLKKLVEKMPPLLRWVWEGPLLLLAIVVWLRSSDKDSDANTLGEC